MITVTWPEGWTLTMTDTGGHNCRLTNGTTTSTTGCMTLTDAIAWAAVMMARK